MVVAADQLPPLLVGELPGGDLEPLTVIHAPRGCGKTALLQVWAQNLPREVPGLPITSISVNTVKAHRRSIYKKLSVGSWEEAQAAARRQGLLG